jgi:hypothetical protein
VFGLSSNHNPGTGCPSSIEPLQELVGQNLSHKRSLIDSFDWRIKLLGDFHFGGRILDRWWAFVETSRKPMRHFAIGPKPCGDICNRQGSKGSQAGQSQTQKHTHQLGPVECRDRKRRQKGW